MLRGVAELPPAPAESRGQALEHARTDSNDYLRVEAANYMPGVDCEFQVEMADDVPGTIAKYAREHEIDFIAMGTHSDRGFKHLLVGSVAEAVLRISPVPVLMVRDGMVPPLPV
jgi:nucleotide-binding universal stress UspA family protein